MVAIGRRLDTNDVLATAGGLAAGGVRAFELTLDEPAVPVLASIRELARRFPEAQLLIGAGTVLSITAARRAIDAGARFLVSPHTDLELIQWAADHVERRLPGSR